MIRRDIFSLMHLRIVRLNFKFVPCPFCGDQPSFWENFKISDDDRYYDIHIACCDFKYYESSVAYRSGGFGRVDPYYGFLNLDMSLIKLGEYWNTRLTEMQESKNAEKI